MFRGEKYLILAGITLGYIALAVLTEAALLQVMPAEGETLPAGVAEKATALNRVTNVERYLLLKTQPHDVIGIEAGSPLRIMTGDGDVVEGKLEAGKTFRKSDEGKNVAIIGRVYAEDYGYRGWMLGMKHFLEIGQTFKLTETGPSIHVQATYSVEPESEASKVFVLLTTAQKLFNRTGELSHLFITVKGDTEAMVEELKASLDGAVKVKVVLR